MNEFREKHKNVIFIKSLIIKIIYIIIIPIVLYDIYLIVQTRINPEKTPNIFGIKTFTIISGSMAPTINVNDIIIIKETGQLDIQKNDIITFRVNDEIVTHKVVNIEVEDNQLVYTTKGDNNEVTDLCKIRYDQIEGKYIGKIPFLGKIFAFLKNEIVFEVMILILVIVYVIEKRNINKKNERRVKRERFEESNVK